MNPMLVLFIAALLLMAGAGLIDTNTGHLDIEHAAAAFASAGAWTDRLSIMVGVVALIMAVLVAVRNGWLSWDMISGGKRKSERLPGDQFDPNDLVGTFKKASDRTSSGKDLRP